MMLRRTVRNKGWFLRLTFRSSPRLGVVFLLALLLSLVGCGDQGQPGAQTQPLVVTDLNFLADVVRNVAGEAATVESLIPEDVDPHAFQATPKDAHLLSQASLLIINVKGLEPSLEELMRNVVGDRVPVVEAAEGIEGRLEDPHVWLDPLNMIIYTRNIVEALSNLLPARAALFRERAGHYNQELRELDEWIKEQVASIPASKRLLVTNHESLGYFAKRYGFTVVGAIFPTVSGEGSPSSRQLSALVEEIKKTGAPAIFLEVGDNLQLARQIAAEAGVQLVTDLHIHSLGGEVRTYLDMMRWNVVRIVGALR